MLKQSAAWPLLVACLALTTGCSKGGAKGSRPDDADERDAAIDDSDSAEATSDAEADEVPDEEPMDGGMEASLDDASAARVDSATEAMLDAVVAPTPESTSNAAADSSGPPDANANPMGHSDAGDDVAVACETTQRTLHAAAPDVMLVVDRSGSLRPPVIDCRMPDIVSAFTTCVGVDCNDPMQAMNPYCGANMTVDRWELTVSAIKSLTQMFDDKLGFGLTTFPGVGASTQTGQPNGCTPGTLRVPVALDTAGPIAEALDMTQIDGYTPTASTLEAVLPQIREKRAANTETPAQFVLLVTDGAPNCVGGSSNMDMQAHIDTLAAIDALAVAGVKTFVMGYNDPAAPNLTKQLTEYAQHGGTSTFYALESGANLPQGLGEAMSTIPDCTYVLEGPAPAREHVRVTLDGNALQAEPTNGFSLTDKTLTIAGSACATLRDKSKKSVLSVTTTCGP